ncbi:ATP-binding cassette domain-containing protein [Aquihabitans sp. G128]|uniref:ABC transporter ATP-binding protein n=1 Tax=Aquihabitans sp. G128 TaxID=2849779 RepID=UPI001C23AEAF|nr:ATP-binding cassette domain-containing protein [Aquihabitans sp. G128]QXC60658.1 ATP-binding cassette domain-containing protein [Aquihabitans sp. G128]
MDTDETHTPVTAAGQPCTSAYDVHVAGRLSGRWAAWFDGFSLTEQHDGSTVLQGATVDQAALHGLLHKLRDLGITLLSVTQLPPGRHRHPTRAPPPRPPRSTLMINVTALTKRYDDRTAVDDLTFTVADGRITGFVGPNGAGKSTTMRMMLGLTRPDHGEVHYGDVRYADLRHPARLVGAVLDPRCMHPGHSARNHLRAMAALSALPAARIDQVLAEVGLESVAGQRTGGFSLGMRQRLALAGALLGDPQVLLLDEPSNGLDPDGIRWLRNHLTDFAGRGGTVFVSSHLIGELSLFADDLVVVGGGKLLAADTVTALTARSTGSVVAETTQPTELARVLTEAHATVEVTGARLSIRGADKATVSELAFEHGIRLVELSEVAPSLEDTLLDLTGASAEYASA